MFQEKIDSRSLQAWTVAGMAAPIAHFLGSVPWYWVLLSGAAAGIFWLTAWPASQEREAGKLLAAAEYLFLILAVAFAAASCGGCWDRGSENTAIPLTLLALSAWAASHGGKTGTGYGAVVFLLSVFLYGVVLIFAVPDVEPRCLLPRWRWDDGLAFGVFLIPGVLRFFPREEKGKPGFWALGMVLFGGAVALLTAGSLSPQVAAYTQGAFFKMASGISILGIAERFEAVVSGVMTMGWFCLMSLLLAAAGHLAEVLLPGKGKQGVWASAVLAGAGMFWTGWIPTWAVVLGALLFWGILPLLSRKQKIPNKMKKVVDKRKPVCYYIRALKKRRFQSKRILKEIFKNLKKGLDKTKFWL